jgi:hypothetical protein
VRVRRDLAGAEDLGLALSFQQAEILEPTRRADAGLGGGDHLPRVPGGLEQARHDDHLRVHPDE